MRYLIAMAGRRRGGGARHDFREPAAGQHGGRTNFTFDSPDEVGNLEDGVFMAANFVALLIGWWLGWLIGGRLAEAGSQTPSSTDRRAMKLLLWAMARWRSGFGRAPRHQRRLRALARQRLSLVDPLSSTSWAAC